MIVRPVRSLSDLPHPALQILAELETLLDRHEAGEPVLFEEHRRHMLEADAGDLPGVIERAAFELRSFSRRQAPAVDRYDVKAVVLKECSGWSPTDVERSAHKASARTVRKWRTDDGRHPETGRPLPGREGSAAEKVAELAGEGKSVRVIALTVGLPKSTVHDMLVGLQERAA